MCGIAGLIADREVIVRDALPSMVVAQAHRGPDDEGETYQPFGHRFLGLGHRRLSILDLSPAGHQPMKHPETGDQIIFNGEIYNFLQLRKELEQAGECFISHCDTEVMLRALTRWGPAAISRFEGMFAFAFFNRRENRLILARDPMGIKPLYVGQTTLPDGGGRVLLFASELRAILASRLIARKLDPAAIASLLAYGVTQQPSTLIQGIRSFPSGCYQVFSPTLCQGSGPTEACSRKTYWNYPRPHNGVTEAEAGTKIRATLDHAVHEHLVSDVPVGVFLSSGLDSTIIAGLAARHTPHLRSFTVGLADRPDLSEHALASETARHFGLQHTAIDIGGSEALAAVTGWLDVLDRPSMDGLNVYVISQAVRARGIVVALSGQGGDELFGGYPSFDQVAKWRAILRAMRWMPGRWRALVGRLLSARRSQAVREKLADILRGDGGILRLALQRRRAMSDGQLAALGLNAARLGLSEDFQPPDAIAALTPDANLDPEDIVWSVSQIESRFYQGNMLLRDSDTNGMAHGLEIRVPLLDQHMLDYVYSLPGHLRLPSGKADKHLLRVAFGDMLRPDLLRQTKKGFALPIGRWMQGPLRPLCEEALANLKSLGLLRVHGIDLLWRAFQADPESSLWSRAFTLCVLGHYIKKIGATI